MNDPLEMYLNDVTTIPANLAGIPAMSIPVSVVAEDGLPVGVQVMAPARADDRLYEVSATIERMLEEQAGQPFYARAPKTFTRGGAN
jgi:aspartyl-tRNA(Asn)/glutamyl-tRNA(Gln) amidotransferase subunit A